LKRSISGNGRARSSLKRQRVRQVREDE